MQSKLVQWQIDDEAAEVASLNLIEKLEQIGYRRAWQRITDGTVTWKLAPPGVYEPEEGERLVDIDPT